MKKLASQIQDSLSRNQIKEFEIYIERSKGLSLEVKGGALDSVEREDSLGFSVRVLNGNQMGFAFGTDFSPAGIDYVVTQARDSAPHTMADPNLKFVPKASVYPVVSNFDPQIHSLSFNEKFELACAVEKAAFAFDPKIKRARYVAYAEEDQEIYLANSLGLELHHPKTNLDLSLMAVAESGSESEMAYDSDSSPFLRDLNPKGLGERAAREAVERLGGIRIPNYKGPIILNPMVTVEILGVLAPSTLIENVHKKNSFLIGKKGQAIYSPAVTLLDDGLYFTGEETRPFDAEGTPRQTTAVIDAGVVNQFLYDSYWAAKDGVASTGNAIRGGATSKPHLGTTNFYLNPGNSSQEALLQTMNRGVLITEAIGVHTADPISGDFSVTVQGFWIENGLKKHPVRSVSLSGNLHELFAKAAEAGSDLKFYGTTGAPSLLVQEASIAGAS